MIRLSNFSYIYIGGLKVVCSTTRWSRLQPLDHPGMLYRAILSVCPPAPIYLGGENKKLLPKLFNPSGPRMTHYQPTPWRPILRMLLCWKYETLRKPGRFPKWTPTEALLPGWEAMYMMGDCLFRELTDYIPNWTYSSQLGISNPQLGIIYPIRDWGYMSLVMQSQRTNHQSPIW